MKGIELLVAVVLGLIVNEFSDVSPWLARKFVVWSARLRYGRTTRADVRAEELAAVINDRPGKLFKLGTGLLLAVAALVVRLRRLVLREPQPTGEFTSEELLSGGRVLPLEPEPSPLVGRYLFPTERYRGEWRRHWIHIVKGCLMIATYAVLGMWATIERVRPQYVDRIVFAIVVGALLLIVLTYVRWRYNRFVITNKRLMSTEGVVFRRVAMTPLLRVTDLRYTQSPLARVLNYGTFRLESASRRNALRRIVNLPNPNELYLRLVEEMYEPAAVEARLWPADEFAPGHEDEGRPDPVAGAAFAPDPDVAPGAGADPGRAGSLPGPRLPAGRQQDDAAMAQRDIVDQISALSAQLGALAATVRALRPATAPDPGPAPQRAVAPDADRSSDPDPAVAAPPSGVPPRQPTELRP